MSHNDASTRRRSPSQWAGGTLAAIFAIVAIVAMWSIALPVTAPDQVCILIYPPAAGCAGDARIVPAVVWSILAAASAALTFRLAKRSWLGAAAGVVLTALIGIAGYAATWNIKLFLFA